MLREMCIRDRPEKPNKNNYEGGVANTEYLAAIKAYCEADAAIQNHLSANCMKGIEEAALSLIHI